jgi:hypothetical protein
MSWGKIKKALNSTVGTSEFQPLDQLLRFSGKNFATSGNVFATPFNGSVRSDIPTNKITGTTVDIVSIRPKISGSFTASASVTTYSTRSKTVFANLSVYVNGVAQSTGQYTGSHSSSGTLSGTASVVVSFNAGDTISFKFNSSLMSSEDGGQFYALCTRLNILGQVVDNLIDVL